MYDTLMVKMATFRTAFTSDKGASMVEYALLVVLIAIVAITAVTLAGKEVSNTFSDIGNELSNP